MENNTITADETDRNELARQTLWNDVKKAATDFSFDVVDEPGEVEGEQWPGSLARLTVRQDVLIIIEPAYNTEALTVRVQRFTKSLIRTATISSDYLYAGRFMPVEIASGRFDADFFWKLFTSLGL